MHKLILIAALTIGCGQSTIREASSELGVATTAAAACALAHGWTGEVPEAEAVARFCSKPEFLEPWVEEAARIEELVNAQRAGKPRPEPEPAPSPTPPPPPPSEPAAVPVPATSG